MWFKELSGTLLGLPAALCNRQDKKYCIHLTNEEISSEGFNNVYQTTQYI